jgi:hypothetical protein
MKQELVIEWGLSGAGSQAEFGLCNESLCGYLRAYKKHRMDAKSEF